MLLVALLSLLTLCIHAQNSNRLFVPDLSGVKSTAITVPVNLSNTTTDVVALQFNITLPAEALTIDPASVSLTDRAADHQIVASSVSADTYKVMVYSPTNTPLKANAGAVVQLKGTITGSIVAGNTYPVQLSDVVISDAKGRNVMTGVGNGTVQEKPSADFTVSDISVSPAKMQPGDTLTVAWRVNNQGAAAAKGGWSERLVLADKQGHEVSLATLYSDSRQLASGGVALRQAKIALPKLLGIDGDVNLKIALVPNADAGEDLSYQSNNISSTANTPLNIGRKLYLQLPTAAVDESNQAAVRCQLGRSGSWLQNETFALVLKQGDSRLSVPAQVAIPAGQSSAYFYVNVADNDQFDADSVFVIEAAGNGYTATQATMTIADDEQLQLKLTASATEITEGDTFQLTVGIVPARSYPVTVNLTSELPARISCPSMVVIPAGQSQQTVSVTALDNDDIELQTTVAFKVSAEHCQSSECLVLLKDNDMPSIALSLTPKSVSEAAGSAAVMGLVKRNGNTDRKITVNLSDDADDAIYYSAKTLVLEKGVNEAQFSIGVVDKAEVDGQRVVRISAAVYASSCNCAAQGGSEGFVTDSITILDDDGPALQLVAPNAVMLEGTKGNIITVSRNTDTAKALGITLSSSQDAQLAYNHSVVIPAGQRSVNVEVEVKANEEAGDNSIVAFTATADGYTQGACWVQISDQSLPDAVLSRLSADKKTAGAGDKLTVTAVLKNQGNQPLPAITPVNIYLNQTLIATAYTQEPLKQNDSVALQKTVSLPNATGKRILRAVVNEKQTVKELLYANNSSANVSIELQPAFTATAKTNKKTYAQGETVTVNGQLTGRFEEGDSIEVYVINDGLRQTVTSYTDEKGNFAATWKPYNRQCGHFIVGACFPGENLRKEMTSFDIYGLTLGANYASEELNVGETATGKVLLTNPAAQKLTQLKVTPQTTAKNITWAVPQTVAGGQSVELTYTVLGDAVTTGNDWLKQPVRLTTAEGVEANFTLYYFVHAQKALLTVAQTDISTTMAKGKTRDYPITLTNSGKTATGKITVSVPDAEWLTCATPTDMASLQPGEQTTVVLRLTPTDRQQLNNMVGATVAMNCENGDGTLVNLRVETVSEETGTLVIDACDEYTYNTKEQPHLQGATVTVQHPVTKQVVATDKTRQDGRCQFVLPEGYYYVTVTEPKHTSYAGTLMVDPAQTTTQVVNLGLNGISIDMTYEKTEIEDEYEIETTVKYETNVPIPVVETNMPSHVETDKLAEGESLLFNVVLTNRGLISAKNTQFVLPEIQDDLTFTLLADNGFELKPQQSVTMPVKVTRINQAAKTAVKKAAKAGGSGCTVHSFTLYESECGPDNRIHSYERTFTVRTCKSSPSNPISPGKPVNPDNVSLPSTGGWTVKGPTGSPSTPSNKKTESNKKNYGEILADKFESFVCDPCVNNFMKAGADCAGWDDDHPVQSIIKKIPVIGDALGCGFDLYNCSKEKGGRWFSRCGGDLFSCAMQACEAIGGTLAGIGTAYKDPKLFVGGKLMEAICKIAGKGKEYGDCGNKLLTACNDLDNNKKNTARSTVAKAESAGNGYPSYITQFQDKMRYVLDGRKAIHDYVHELLGTYDFENADLADMYLLLQKIGEQPADQLIEASTLAVYKPESVSDSTFAAFIARINNTMLREQGKAVTDTNYIHTDRIEGYLQRIKTCNEVADNYGYNSVADMVEDAYTQLLVGYEGAGNSVCSSVTLQLSQTATMTRQAIRGTLTVLNGHAANAMKDVKLNLTVFDKDGNIAGTDLMQVVPESLEGFEGQLDLTAGWSLKANTEGKATVLFIPTKTAAKTAETPYTFKGSISYVDPFADLEVMRELTPTTLTVNPSPNLDLDYFMQRDIYGDDPLTTDVVEPSKTAEFALVVNNKGYGDATNVRMITRQPAIVDNEKGLDVKFQIESSQLNGADATLALNANIATEFGNIAAHKQAYAQWWLKSSLLGHFTAYDVKTTHVTSYGNENLSLLDHVAIHELIHGFTVAKTDSQTVRGFLVNDIADAADLPDMVYFSNGTEEQTVQQAAATDMAVDGDNQYKLTITPAASGWQYGAVADVTAGKQELIAVKRMSDGAELAADNFWTTDRTLRDGHNPVYENKLHFIVNADQTETYQLTFAPRATVELCVDSIVGAPEAGKLMTAPLRQLKVLFNKPIVERTFTADAIRLNCQGKQVAITGIAVSKQTDNAYLIDLGDATLANGYYVLTVQTQGITDAEGYQGSQGKQTAWTQYADGKVAVSVAIEPDQSGTATPATARQPYGEAIAFAAQAARGYEFAYWKRGDEICSRTATFSYTPVADEAFTVVFIPVKHHVTVSYDAAAGTVGGSQTGIYDHHTTLQLTAEAAQGYEFAGWTVNGKAASAEATLQYTVDSDAEIEARFNKLSDVTLHLKSGWNWIAHNAQTPLEPQALIPEGADRLVAATQQLVYTEEKGWTGSLANLTADQMYKVHMLADVEAAVTGPEVDAAEWQTELKAGVNWVGYPLDKTLKLHHALGNVQPDNGDYMVGQRGFATYHNGTWIATLTTLVPGEGYQYGTQTGKTLSYTQQTATTAPLHAADVATASPWQVDRYAYPQVMPVVAQLQANGMDADANRYVIAAFCGTECRGVGAVADGFVLMNVYGTAGDNITFKAYAADNSQEYEVTPSVQLENTMRGSADKPLLLNVNTASGISAVSLSWRVSSPMYERLYVHGFNAPVSLRLTDTAGATVLCLGNVGGESGADVSRLADGVYILTVEAQGRTLRTKVVKRHR